MKARRNVQLYVVRQSQFEAFTLSADDYRLGEDFEERRCLRVGDRCRSACLLREDLSHDPRRFDPGEFLVEPLIRED